MITAIRIRGRRRSVLTVLLLCALQLLSPTASAWTTATRSSGRSINNLLAASASASASASTSTSTSSFLAIRTTRNQPLQQQSSSSSSSSSSRPSLAAAAAAAASPASGTASGNLHGENACFLPLNQLDMDYYAPRIFQIAGAYGATHKLSREEYYAVQSEASPDQGQWTYDFSDPDGPQLGTVAIEGSAIVHACQDPVVIIAEHPSIGISLPEEIKDPVDLIVLVDRANTEFAERKFLVVDVGGTGEVSIGAYETKADIPANSEILGRVELVQIPWLPSMAPTKTGFMEEDEYF